MSEPEETSRLERKHVLSSQTASSSFLNFYLGVENDHWWSQALWGEWGDHNSPSLILVLLKLYEVWETRSLESKPTFKLPYFGVA